MRRTRRSRIFSGMASLKHYLNSVIGEAMAEADFRLVEGGGESLQLDALTARICSTLNIG